MNSSTLPNVEAAFIPPEKLRDCLLNPEHVDGRHKCRVFRSAFGVGPDDWERFGQMLLHALASGTVQSRKPAKACVLYEVQLELDGQDGTKKRVASIWKIPNEGGAPSLVTAYLET